VPLVTAGAGSSSKDFVAGAVAEVVAAADPSVPLEPAADQKEPFAAAVLVPGSTSVARVAVGTDPSCLPVAVAVVLWIFVAVAVAGRLFAVVAVEVDQRASFVAFAFAGLAQGKSSVVEVVLWLSSVAVSATGTFSVAVVPRWPLVAAVSVVPRWPLVAAAGAVPRPLISVELAVGAVLPAALAVIAVVSVAAASE